MGAVLKLWLSEGKNPELLKFWFSSPLLQAPLSSVRGQTSGATKGAGSFPWSASVQALTIFLLQAAVAGDDTEPHLSGPKGSPAASLDYALSKQPNWLCEIFGTDRNGDSLARRIIRRSNPNAKRPGPIELSLSIEARVVVYVGEEEISDKVHLVELKDRLELSWACYGKRRLSGAGFVKRTPTAAVEEKSSVPQRVFYKAYRIETERGLRSINMFERSSLIESARNLSQSESFYRVLGKETSLIHEEELSLSPSQRIGLADERWLKKHLCADKPIRIACAVSCAGANVLFRYLRDIKGYNIEIDNAFVHALETANRIRANDSLIDHDLCVIASAPAASLLKLGNRSEYLPLTFLPSSSQRLIAPAVARSKKTRKQQDLGQGDYYLLFEEPSTASFYFDDLEKQGEVNRSRILLHHKEPFELPSILSDGGPDIRAILFFPYHTLNVLENNCVYLDAEQKKEQFKEMILFGSRSFVDNRPVLRALLVSLRNAWLELLNNPAAVDACLKGMLPDSSFEKLLRRCAGLR